MISVDIDRKNRMIGCFTVKGHANYDKHGEDIVCSGVTAVVYGALGALEELCGIFEYEDVSEGDKNDYVKFTLPDQLTNEVRDRASIILETMFIGLKQIELVYGEYVSINEREV